MKKAVKARQRTTLFQCWDIILISILGLGALSSHLVSQDYIRKTFCRSLCCQWYYITPSSPMTEQAAQRPIQARSQRQLIRRQPQARSLKLYFWLPHFYVIQSQVYGMKILYCWVPKRLYSQTKVFRWRPKSNKLLDLTVLTAKLRGVRYLFF